MAVRVGAQLCGGPALRLSPIPKGVFVLWGASPLAPGVYSSSFSCLFGPRREAEARRAAKKWRRKAGQPCSSPQKSAKLTPWVGGVGQR
eukprot:scaffold268291_cov41-Tisochrysis_lutea.AAC.2